MNNKQKYVKQFYPLKILYKAQNDYSKIANIKISEMDEYCICEFTDCTVDTPRVIVEFNNYLLELLNSSDIKSEL